VQPASLLVDGRGLYRSGIGRYLREVLEVVVRDPRFARIVLLASPGDAARFLDGRGLPQVEAVSFPHGFYSPAAQAHWALLGARGALRADAAFFPHYDVPLARVPMPYALTVHDLGHFRLPEMFPAWKRAAASRILARAVRRAARVLVISEATRRELLERHPEAAPRVELIPQGVSADFGSALDPAAVERAAALAPYLLCVGNRKPHKNLAAAVEVLARLRSDDAPGLRLVIAGQRMGEVDEVHARAAALGIADAIVDVGEVDDALLAALYAGAEVFLFPSLYEGFGLPVLEAMACGAPVVASDRSAIPEAVGDAGALVDPEDHVATAAAVRRLMVDAGHRAEMVRRGRARAAELTWERTARRTADALWQVAARASGRRGG
jgi:glycosyltransferase involved in cell wall biosynthesis